MSGALTAPFLLAAGLLILAGVGKLLRPGTAGLALVALGLPPARPALRSAAVRAFAVAEIALGAVCLISPGRPGAVAMAALYATFAGATLALARRRAACGCFGESDAPASPLQSLLSAALAAVAIAAAINPVHGLGWVLGGSALPVAVSLVGLAGALYAAAVAYRELPRAWTAWSAR